MHALVIFPMRLQNQMAVLDPSIFFPLDRVVLSLIVADIAPFIAPFIRIGQPTVIEFI
ncbi:MAG: hypothetical protein ETSY1_32720 [Candidatus Entotheonella factor]|uniref:Uncharacterized protein n=1 Tax=Entotheonella factor TaxID=1429438 RepID=W4LAJ3_ENTF1|nr:MAG: hypothetical protein ETSY1_32720 [Candidatus Entotheonella factor]